MSCYFPTFLQHIHKTISDPTANLSQSLQPIFDKLDLKGCKCSRIYRQRTALILINLGYLRQSMYNISYDQIEKVLEMFISFCQKDLEKFEEYELWIYHLEPELDYKLLSDSLKVLCTISPKKFVNIIEKLYCISDESNGMKMVICKELETQIQDSPLIIIHWIEAFQLFQFKSDILEPLALSCMLKNIDIRKFLMTNNCFKNSVLSILDKYVSNRPYPPGTSLVAEFLSTFSAADLSSIIYDLAYPDMCVLIPNTMECKAIKNFENIFSATCSLDERRVLVLQALESAKHSIMKIQEIINCVHKYASENFALALTTFAKEYMRCETLNGLNALIPYNENNNYSSSIKDDVSVEIQKFLKLYISSSVQNNIDSFCDDFQFFLVDNLEMFHLMIDPLWNTKNMIVAFDVKSNCAILSSGTTCQEAVLLTLAFADYNIYMVDIIALKKILLKFEWESFFELLFGRNVLRRLGFDIEENLILLQNTFPFLGKILLRKKPKFLSLPDMVETLSKNRNALKTFFNGRRPELSFEYITKAFLNVQVKKVNGKWSHRPLDTVDMEIAAFDCYYIMKGFYAIRDGLNTCEWRKLKFDNYKTSNSMKVFQKRTRKETLKEIFEHSESILEEIKPSGKANGILIVLDSALVEFRGILYRCGFMTWDHRDRRVTANKKAADMLYDMGELLKRIPIVSRPFTFVLTNKKILPLWISAFQSTVICVDPEEPESIIMEKIIRQTLASIDFSTIYERCSFCGKADSNFSFPLEAFRLLYQSYAKVQGFADREDNILDEIKSFRNYDTNFYVEKEKLVFQDCSKIYYFSLNGKDCNVSFGFKTLSFQCDSKLSDLDGRADVKFCRRCSAFF